ncbi:MAG: prepilin-type N-terminal cleavage/methylation domain-containing protein, partial [Deltaproteobacteria bacterium]|nr:prepilin-type N-terminal cleavage/methylation domain-containing protein [Deltaproteobacteria bacterium]
MKTLKCNYLSNNAKPGMTLIEVLVSVAVIGIGCLAVITVHISSLKSKIMADNMNLAKTIAVTELERLKTLEFNEALNSANTEVNKLDHLGRPCLENQVCPNHIFT